MIVDNFALENYQTCPAKYFLRIKEHWVPVRRKAALGFGGCVHEGLAELYATSDRAKAVQRLVDSWPENMPTDDYRNKEKCVHVFAEYLQMYPQENWRIIGFPEAPLVEKAFTLDTGLTTFDGEPIQYGGIIDAGIDFNGQVYVLEHKTTSMMGAGYFLQFKPNNQVTGYIWALQQLTGKKVGGAIINAIGVYKSQATKFERHVTNRSDEEIAEWLRDVQWHCNEIRRSEIDNRFPMRTKACTLYGLCDYHNVHVLANETERQKRLESDYVRSEWNHEARDD